MQTSNASTSTTSSPASAAHTGPERRTSQLLTADGLHKYSCVVCAARKIKCDRKEPCGNCTKNHSQCLYRAPAPPRRRKKGTPGQNDVLERLKRAEEFLASQQASEEGADRVDTSSFNNIMWRVNDLKLEKQGQLISSSDSSRYLDSSMWIWLNEELRSIRSALEDDPLDEETPNNSPNYDDEVALTMLSGNTPKSIPLQDYHPSAVHILQMWQLYLENIHPIVKILHGPTTQASIVTAASQLDNVPKPLECIMFAMYYLVIRAIEDADCQTRFGAGKTLLLARYRAATQIALLRVDYLNSFNFSVLQAYMLYLIALRPSLQPAAMWALSGIAVRMGHRMGLHRDGETLGLGIFETELRRRLWWEIIFFDSRLGQLSGTGGLVIARGAKYMNPRNVNDSDLYPGMTHQPVEHEGITEMIQSMLRAEVGKFLLSFPQSGTFDGNWQGLSGSPLSLAERDRLIDELEERVRRKWISKCDPRFPNQLLAMKITESAIASIRLMAHHPQQHPGGVVPPEEEVILFNQTCKVLENALFVQKEPSLLRFAFFTRIHFQYLAFVYMLKLLRTHTSGPWADRGWDIIDTAFSIEPSLMANAPGTLYKAVCDLAISAWEAREAANPGLVTPGYIEHMRAVRGKTDSSQRASPQQVNDFAVATNVDTENQLNEASSDMPRQGLSTVQEPMFANNNLDMGYTVQQPYQPGSWEDWDAFMQDGVFDFNLPPTATDTSQQGQSLPGDIPADLSNLGTWKSIT